MTVIPIVLPFSGSLESTSDCTVPPGDGDGVASVASAALQIARNMAAPSMPQILIMDFFDARVAVVGTRSRAIRRRTSNKREPRMRTNVSEDSILCLHGAPRSQGYSLRLRFEANGNAPPGGTNTCAFISDPLYTR